MAHPPCLSGQEEQAVIPIWLKIVYTLFVCVISSPAIWNALGALTTTGIGLRLFASHSKP
jgi:hypothetical protein